MLKNSRWIPSRFLVCLIIPIGFSGCLYSTQHFNNGRLLEPGHSAVTLGAGVDRTVSYGCPSGWDVYETHDSTGSSCIHYSYNNPYNNPLDSLYTGPKLDTLPYVTTWTKSIKTSLGYRLGVSGPWGPFPGAEIGMHLEVPTNPASGEFDLKLGLPVPTALVFHHSLSTGWSIGLWADNSYFLEYAISHSWGENSLFGNYRATYLASQMADLKEAVDNRIFVRHQRLIHQASLGFTWALPDISVLPDFLSPQAILTYPLGPTSERSIPAYLLDDHVLDFNLGMGWRF